MSNTISKKLPSAWSVGGTQATDVELRAPLLEDLLEAEKDAHPAQNPNAFNVALAARTMVRAGTFTGPFTPGQFNKLKPRVWYAIRDAMDEADKLGEELQPGQAPTS